MQLLSLTYTLGKRPPLLPVETVRDYQAEVRKLTREAIDTASAIEREEMFFRIDELNAIVGRFLSEQCKGGCHAR